ncbi:MAG: PucR family transcriptional regulator [Lachnospiraceae bacterium]|nr:PucR family transcriptional regulator [Lachnospiraceae bacterium]
MPNRLQKSFYPTIEELLTLPAFRDCTVVAGSKGLGHRVCGVNLSDTPDYHKWLTKDEIMATTCFSIHNDSQAIESFVSNVYKRGLSGIFIKPKQYLGSIPRVMKEQADAYDLPLIELPDTVRLSGIVKAVFDEITKRETDVLRQSLAVNRTLIRTILDGADLDDIARMISEQTGASVMITDTVNGRRALCIAKSDQEVFREADEEKTAQIITDSAVPFPLQAEGASFGQIYFYGEASASDMDETLLTQLLSVIPLEISARQSKNEARRRELSAFIRHLFSDPITDMAWEESRALEYGLRPKDAYVVLLLKLEELRTNNGNSGLFQRALFIGGLKNVFARRGYELQVVERTDQIVFIAGIRPENERMQELALAIKRMFADAINQYHLLRLTGGLSASNRGIAGLVNGIRQAEVCMKVTESLGIRYICFEDMGILRMVYSDNPEYAISRFLHEVLRDLLDAGQPRNVELMTTLESYLRNGGNVRQVSKDLYTHYNTVSYRLKKIEEITGADLRDPDDRFLLDLALRLIRITSGQII